MLVWLVDQPSARGAKGAEFEEAAFSARRGGLGAALLRRMTSVSAGVTQAAGRALEAPRREFVIPTAGRSL